MCKVGDFVEMDTPTKTIGKICDIDEKLEYPYLIKFRHGYYARYKISEFNKIEKYIGIMK